MIDIVEHSDIDPDELDRSAEQHARAAPTCDLQTAVSKTETTTATEPLFTETTTSPRTLASMSAARWPSPSGTRGY